MASHNRAPLSPKCMDCGLPYSMFRDQPDCPGYKENPND